MLGGTGPGTWDRADEGGGVGISNICERGATPRTGRPGPGMVLAVTIPAYRGSSMSRTRGVIASRA
jgi:hypothetical protein